MEKNQNWRKKYLRFRIFSQILLSITGAYSEPYQTSKMAFFEKIVTGSKLLTILQKAPS